MSRSVFPLSTRIVGFPTYALNCLHYTTHSNYLSSTLLKNSMLWHTATYSRALFSVCFVITSFSLGSILRSCWIIAHSLLVMLNCSPVIIVFLCVLKLRCSIHSLVRGELQLPSFKCLASTSAELVHRNSPINGSMTKMVTTRA